MFVVPIGVVACGDDLQSNDNTSGESNPQSICTTEGEICGTAICGRVGRCVEGVCRHPEPSDDDVITFASVHVEAAVREQLRPWMNDPDGDIRLGAFLRAKDPDHAPPFAHPGIDTLEVRSVGRAREFDSFAGVECIPEILELRLNGFESSSADLDPLSGHPLRQLQLPRTSVDMVPLVPLAGTLKSLTIDVASSVDLDSLDSLDAVDFLHLTITGPIIPDLTPLTRMESVTGLRLNVIGEVSSDQLAPIGKMENLRGFSLNATNSQQPIDLTPLFPANGSQLTSLDVHGAPESIEKPWDLSPLAGLSRLERLELEHVNIGSDDLAALGQITSLTWLDIQNSDVSRTLDISGLGGLQRMTNLKIPGLAAKDLSPLASMSVLDHIDIRDCGATSLDGLGLAEIRSINANDCNIDDISAVASSPKLNWMLLRGNNISSLAPITKLTKIKRLDIRNNEIVSIAPLSSFAVLTELKADSNQIQDASALATMPALETVTLWQNPDLDCLTIPDIEASIQSSCE